MERQKPPTWEEFNRMMNEGKKPREWGDLDLGTDKDKAIDEVRRMVDELDYERLIMVIKNLKDGDPLVTQGDFLTTVHELLISQGKKGFRTTSDGYDEETFDVSDAYLVSIAIVEKMGNNRENLSYLKRIFYEGRVPFVVIKDIENSINSGAELDEYDEANYFWYVVNALAKMNTDDSVAAIEAMLLDIVEKNRDYINRYRFPNDDYFGLSRDSQTEESSKGFEYSHMAEEIDSGIAPEHTMGFNFGCGLFKANAIRALGNAKRQSSVDAIMGYIKEDGEDSLLVYQHILHAFEQINQNRAAGKLLILAKSGDQSEKRTALFYLYRMEFGKIGISEEGVRYLEKVYDLGTDNNPDYFVNRLTANGDVGIFNRDSRLIKYFNLGDLTTPESRVKAEVLGFTYETLFTPKPNETPEERQRRERVLEEFQSKYFDFYNDDFFEQTKVHFNNLSFREQGWFLHFISNADKAKKARAMDFVKNYGEEGLRTFLSLDFGDDLGGKILEIGEALPKTAAQAVYMKYGEIIDSVDYIDNQVVGIMQGEKGFSPEARNRIINSLLAKGKDLLMKFSDSVVIQSVEAKKISGKDLLQSLSRVKAGILLFASTFREVSKQPDFSVEEFVAKSIEIKDSEQLTEQEKQELLSVFKSNRDFFPADLHELRIKRFEKNLNEPGHQFKILKQAENIIAFYAVNFREDGTAYVHSFNLDPNARGTSVAIAMAKIGLEEIGNNHNMDATVYEKNVSVLRFYKSLGFKETGKSKYENSDYEYIKLARPKTAKSLEPQTAELAA